MIVIAQSGYFKVIHVIGMLLSWLLQPFNILFVFSCNNSYDCLSWINSDRPDSYLSFMSSPYITTAQTDYFTVYQTNKHLLIR